MLIWITVLSMVTLVGIDQLTKWWAATYLAQVDAIPVIKGVFEFRYCENTGVAFSMFENQQWLFIPLSLLATVAVLVMLFRSQLNRYKTFVVTCILIASGALGNLIDRVLYGYVIDFLYFRLINFPIFNFADCCVTIGGALMFVVFIFLYKDDETPLRTVLFGIEKKVKNNG